MFQLINEGAQVLPLFHGQSDADLGFSVLGVIQTPYEVQAADSDGKRVRIEKVGKQQSPGFHHELYCFSVALSV